MPQDRKNTADAARAIRTGGRALAEITGNPEDAKIKPKVGPKQRRAAELVQGFTKLGSR